MIVPRKGRKMTINAQINFSFSPGKSFFMILINASIQKVTKERKSIVAIINPISGKPGAIIL